jgi:hypothetical protein
VAEVGVYERTGFETEVIPIDLFRKCRGDLPTEESSGVGGVGKSSLEELVVGLVDGVF